jgi:hypothetical protein
LIGYLSNLRLLEAHRNRGLVARGYRYFRELHRDRRASLYLTTIAAGNETAIRLLTSGRAGLPAYHYAGNYHTLAIPASRRNRTMRFSQRNAMSRRTRRMETGGVATRPRDTKRVAGYSIRQASADDMPEILRLVAEEGPKRQFFPCYSADDFFNPSRTFLGLAATDLLLAIRDGKLVGSMGVWDQRSFRQIIVHSYGRGMRVARPFYNVWAWCSRRPLLPAAGQSFPYVVAVLPIAAGNNSAVFGSLLRAAMDEASLRSADYLLLGLHSDDPLLPEARRFATNCYTTRLYLVCWDDGEPLRRSLDCRPPYLELGSL